MHLVKFIIFEMKIENILSLKLLKRFEIFDLGFVQDFGAIVEPISNIRFVHESPFPPLVDFLFIAYRSVNCLSVNISFQAFICSLPSLYDLHRFQVVAEILIPLNSMTTEGFNFLSEF